MWNVADRDEDGRDDDDAPHDLGARRTTRTPTGGDGSSSSAAASPCLGCAPGCSLAAGRRRRAGRDRRRRPWPRSPGGETLPSAAYGSAWPGLARQAHGHGETVTIAPARRSTGPPRSPRRPARAPSAGPSAAATRRGRAALRARRTSCSACSPASQATAGARCPVRRLRGIDLGQRLHAQLRTGLGAGGRDQARARGVGLGRVQALGRAAGAVHPRRAAGADDHLEPAGHRPVRLRGLAVRPAPGAPSTRSP